MNASNTNGIIHSMCVQYNFIFYLFFFCIRHIFIKSDLCLVKDIITKRTELTLLIVGAFRIQNLFSNRKPKKRFENI